MSTKPTVDTLMSQPLPDPGVVVFQIATKPGGVQRWCAHCDRQAVAGMEIPGIIHSARTTTYYLCRMHLAVLRRDLDALHDSLKEEARSMLDHPVSYTNKTEPPTVRYLRRRVAQRKRRNNVAGQSETIKAARAKLSAEITVDAIDELAFAWAQAVYARGGV